MNSFDGDVKKWNVAINADISDDRINRYTKIIKYINEEPIRNIKTLERIGSDSSAGEVFLYNISDENIAIKILPIISSYSNNINKKEVELARELSDLVLNNRSIYFPIVYKDTFCHSTFFYNHNSSIFRTKSLNFQPNRYIESINSHLLFSELAHTDLKNYLNKKISKNLLLTIILQVFEAISDLQILCKIVHNDLHLGNILLLFNPEYKVNILIHDFGRSLKINKLSSFQKKTDILTFLNEIKKYIHIYLDYEEHKFFTEKIQETIELLDDIIVDYPILEVIKLWTKL